MEHRADVDAGRERIPDAKLLLVSRHEKPLEVVVHVVVHVGDPGGRAPLAARARRAEQHRLDRLRHVGVGVHHRRVVTAQLEEGTNAEPGRSLGRERSKKRLAHSLAAGALPHREPRIPPHPSRQRLVVARVDARHETGEAAVGSEHVVDDLGQRHRAERRFRMGLPYHAVARGHRRKRAPRERRVREVERGRLPDDADG